VLRTLNALGLELRLRAEESARGRGGTRPPPVVAPDIDAIIERRRTGR